jgi:hypothetical protein
MGITKFARVEKIESKKIENSKKAGVMMLL